MLKRARGRIVGRFGMGRRGRGSAGHMASAVIAAKAVSAVSGSRKAASSGPLALASPISFPPSRKLLLVVAFGVA